MAISPMNNLIISHYKETLMEIEIIKREIYRLDDIDDRLSKTRRYESLMLYLAGLKIKKVLLEQAFDIFEIDMCGFIGEFSDKGELN